MAAGLIIGAVEVVLAVAFAALVFAGATPARLGDGIGLYLVAAALTLGFLAWRAGMRGVVGSVQDAATAVLSILALSTATKAINIIRICQTSSIGRCEVPDVFLTVVAATLVVTVSCGAIFLLLGTFRLGNLVRFIPYPVVGGFLAGTGWLLFKGGIYIASGVELHLRTFGLLVSPVTLKRWVPALAFGVILLLAVRRVKKPLVIPIVLGIGIVLFAIGMLVTGSSIDAAQHGRWLLGPFESCPAVAAVDASSDHRRRLVGGARPVGRDPDGRVRGNARDLVQHLGDRGRAAPRPGHQPGAPRRRGAQRGLRPAGWDPRVPRAQPERAGRTHERERAGRRARRRARPLAAVVFGAAFIELIPRMIVAGVLVFLGLAFIVEWVWDKRLSLPPFEYAIVLAILATIIGRDFLTGVVVGLVLAGILFAVNYGRIELVREVASGRPTTATSTVLRQSERCSRTRGDLVQILRVNGFVFFGSINGLLERIRKRVEVAPLRFLVIDLRRVTGVDSSGVVAFVKVMHLAEANGFELVFTGASDQVRKQLGQGGVVESEGIVRFEPDLDRGLQRCEEDLLEGAAAEPLVVADGSSDGLAGMPPGLRTYLERRELPEGTVPNSVRTSRPTTCSCWNRAG